MKLEIDILSYLYPLVLENQVEYQNPKAKMQNQDNFRERLNLQIIFIEQQTYIMLPSIAIIVFRIIIIIINFQITSQV